MILGFVLTIRFVRKQEEMETKKRSMNNAERMEWVRWSNKRDEPGIWRLIGWLLLTFGMVVGAALAFAIYEWFFIAYLHWY